MKQNALIKKFLSIMGNPKMCYNIDPAKKISSMVFARSIDEAIEKNEAGSDIYFYINGGPKEVDVSTYSFCYIDLDAGRDANGKYLDTRKVASAKTKMLKKLIEFKMPPTLIVETRNGYQAYWQIAKSTDKALWSGVESRLVTYFADVGADKRTIKPNQLYRVPFTYWQKKSEGKQKFYCTIAKQNTTKYSLNDFKNIFKDLGVSSHERTETVSYASSYKQPWAMPSQPATPASLITEVIDFLDQVYLPLSMTKNKFLAQSAKQLASKLSNEYCVK